MAWQDFQIFRRIESEYHSARTPEEFRTWMEGIHTDLREVKHSGDEDAIDRLTKRRGILKKFFEEALPVNALLSGGSLTEIDSIQMSNSNGAWDAKLTLAGQRIIFLEITATGNGEHFAIAMAFLKKFKQSPSRFLQISTEALWEIWRTKDAVPETLYEAHKVSEEISLQADQASECIRVKSINDYGTNTSLLVSLDNVDTELDLSEVKAQVVVDPRGRQKFVSVFLVRCNNPAAIQV